MEKYLNFREYVSHPLSLLFTTLTFFGIGCREKRSLESYVENKNPPSIERYYEPPKSLSLSNERSLEGKCDKEPKIELKKPQDMTFERFKLEKLGDRYDSLNWVQKKKFDETFEPQDWRMLDEILENPLCFIKKTADGLKSSDYLVRYLKFKESGYKDLSEKVKKDIKDAIPILNLDKPEEFDKAAAFIFLEINRILYGDEYLKR